MTYQNEIKQKAWEDDLSKLVELYANCTTYEEFKAKKAAMQFNVKYHGIDLLAYYHFKRCHPTKHIMMHVLVNAMICGVLSSLLFLLLPSFVAGLITLVVCAFVPLILEIIWDSTIGYYLRRIAADESIYSHPAFNIHR